MAGDISISTPSFVNKEELLLQLGAASLAGLMLKSAELCNHFFSNLSKERKAAALKEMFKALSKIKMQTQQGEEVKKAVNVIASAAQMQAMGNALLEMRNVVERAQAATALGHAAEVAKYAIEQTEAQASAIGAMFNYMASVLERTKVAMILGNLASVAANAIATASSTASATVAAAASTLTKVSSTLSSNLPNAKEAAKAATAGSSLWIFLALVAMNLMEDNKEENDKTVEHPDSANTQEEETSITYLAKESENDDNKILEEEVHTQNKPLLTGFNAANLKGSFGVKEQPLLQQDEASKNKRILAPAA